jgi:hypothetical protein
MKRWVFFCGQGNGVDIDPHLIARPHVIDRREVWFGFTLARYP